MMHWLGRALIALGAAGMVYGVYLWMGKAAAVLLGSFIVYVAGYHISMRGRKDSALKGHDEARQRVRYKREEQRAWLN